MEFLHANAAEQIGAELAANSKFIEAQALAVATG